jgi:hypothetical protein
MTEGGSMSVGWGDRPDLRDDPDDYPRRTRRKLTDRQWTLIAALAMLVAVVVLVGTALAVR